MESTGSEVVFSDTHPETWTEKCQGCFSSHYLRMTSETFGCFWTSLAIFGYVRVIFEKTWHSQDKNLMPINQLIYVPLAGHFYYNYSSSLQPRVYTCIVEQRINSEV